MTRPCFLVVDREYAASISTRKLVIETAKLNVITAYSGAEALEMLERFPRVDGAVVDLGVKDVPSDELVPALKAIAPGLPVIAIATPRNEVCPEADYILPTVEPARLLELLLQLQPEAAAAIDRQEENLAG